MMKKNLKPIISLVMMCILCTALALPASARASAYFSSYDLAAKSEGSGKVKVSIDVTATRTMSEVGFSSVSIYEQQSNGTYKSVATYGKMTDSNSLWAYRTLTYQGTSGKSYYAKVSLYAKDAKGSETLIVNTNVTTA